MIDQKKIDQYFKEADREQKKNVISTVLACDFKTNKKEENNINYERMDENMQLKQYYTDEVVPFKSKKFFTIMWHIPNRADQAVLAVYEIAHSRNLPLLEKIDDSILNNYCIGDFKVVSSKDIGRVCEHQQRLKNSHQYVQEDRAKIGRMSVKFPYLYDHIQDSTLSLKQFAILDRHGIENSLVDHSKVLAINQVKI